MGSVYPTMKPSTPGQTITSSVGYGKPTPGSVIIEVANDNKPRVRLPTPANDNAVIRHTAGAIARIARVGLRLHPWVRAASLALDVLDALEQTGRDGSQYWDFGALPGGNAINRLSWDLRYVSVVGTKATIIGKAVTDQVHNLMPHVIMYPANATANYPPGIQVGIGGQALGTPGFPSNVRAYWNCRLSDNPNAWANTNRYRWLWGYRMNNSVALGQEAPLVTVPARAPRRVPSTEPFFTPLPWTSPMPVGRPAPMPTPIKGVGTLPGREVGPLPDGKPRPGVDPNSPPNQPRPPTGRTKERKFAIAVGGAWAAGINFVTEGLDLVAALYKSLPKWLQNKLWKENGGYMSPYDKALAIVQYFHLIQGDELIFNLLDMQSEDRTYGKIGGHVKNANANLIGGGGITLGYL